MTTISQRYVKLCYLIYKANGVETDEQGKVSDGRTARSGPPALFSTKLRARQIAGIRPARPPTAMNVHRWTLEEDVTILRAVPAVGNQWADIATLLLPHRDRGHIRKRFQVLQRRVPKGRVPMSLGYLRRSPPLVGRPPVMTDEDMAVAVTLAVKLDQPKRMYNQMRKEKKSLKKAPKKATAGTKAKAVRAKSAKKTPAKQAPRPLLGKSTPTNHEEVVASVLVGNFSQRFSQQQPRPTALPPLASTGGAAAAAARDVGTVHDDGRRDEPAAIPAPAGGSEGPAVYRQDDEDTKMDVERILGQDDWSGMERLIESGAAESRMAPSPRKGAALRRSPRTAAPGTPGGAKASAGRSLGSLADSVRTPSGRVSTRRTATFSTPGTSARGGGPPPSSRGSHKPTAAAGRSPPKDGLISPLNFCDMPLNEISEHQGCNSLIMAESDFDAVTALNELSNSAPSPTRLIHAPHHDPLTADAGRSEVAAAPHAAAGAGLFRAGEGGAKEGSRKAPPGKKGKMSLFSKVQSRIDDKDKKKARKDSYII